MLLDKILNTVFSFGAAVVIFGAWGKLEHAVFGDAALTAGLLTETAIFCLYGLLEWIRRPAPASHPTAVEGKQEHKSAVGPIAHSDPTAHKKELEALTSSIKETSNLLARIFRV
jgi:hypothetical protein